MGEFNREEGSVKNAKETLRSKVIGSMISSYSLCACALMCFKCLSLFLRRSVVNFLSLSLRLLCG